MKCEINTSYHPTLWRTCRILAHVKRLACLKMIVECPSATVGEVAVGLRVPVNQASMFLRALQARGLISAQRQSRWVRYAPVPDPLVPEASCILKALRQALIVEKRPAADIKRDLTAFTHPRRLTILLHLFAASPVGFEELAAATRISRPALSRHLAKLALRQLIRYEDSGVWLASPPHRLSAALLQLARSAAP